ncbi:MAG: Hpt domain-containing protein [Pseudomonadota bacterium]
MLVAGTPCVALDQDESISRSDRRKRARSHSPAKAETPAKPITTEAKTSRDSADGAIDRVHLARYTMGDLALENEILALFAAQLPSMLKTILHAETRDDLMRAGHTLKGSARAIGAWKLAEVAKKTEEFASTDVDLSSDETYQHVLCQLNKISDDTLASIASALR